jgi:hypothetical protein
MTQITPIAATMLVMASRRWAQSTSRWSRCWKIWMTATIGEIGDENDEVAAPLARFARIPDTCDSDPQNERSRKPRSASAPELFTRPLKFLVSEMPLQIDEPPGDLAPKAEQQGREELCARLSRLVHASQVFSTRLLP